MFCNGLHPFECSSYPRSVFPRDFPWFLISFSRFWEPSPAELPSKFERVSEPARSEDLEDFNRILMDFPRIWSSAGAEPSSAEPERSSAEPEASSADVKIIEIS